MIGRRSIFITTMLFLIVSFSVIWVINHSTSERNIIEISGKQFEIVGFEVKPQMLGIRLDESKVFRYDSVPEKYFITITDGENTSKIEVGQGVFQTSKRRYNGY